MDDLTHLPVPLTPADADLRDFRFMPFDVVRFAQSDLVAFEEPAAVLANELLWCVSWHSLPAGSLTDDDRVLARASGYGRGGSEWDAVRKGALHGWVKCSDGRLYHPVVAEKVIEAWQGKLERKHRTYCAAIRKHNERNPDKKLEPPSFEQWDEAGRPEKVTRDIGGMSRVTGGDVTLKTPSVSRPSHAKNRSKGKGEGQWTVDSGQGQLDSDPSGGAAKRGTRLPDDFVMPGDWIDEAIAKGLPRPDAIRESEKFANYWQSKSGKDATKIDWRKTWRNWVMTADKGRGRNFNGAGQEYLGV